MASGRINTAEIIKRLVQRGGGTGVSNMEATLLTDADKVDPFNMWAVLAVEARINGKPGAWVVQTPNDGSQDVVSRLLDGMVEQIMSNPDQDRGSAATNRTTV